MNLIKNKIDWFEYVYFVMIVIYAAMATDFTKTMMFYTNQPIGFAIPIVMTVLLLLKNRISFKNKNIILILVVYSIWLLFQYIKYTQYNISASLYVFYNILIAYILIAVYKTKIFIFYEKILTQLSVIAIIGWLLMLFLPESFGNLIDAIKIPDGEHTIIRGNIFIFTMPNINTSDYYQALNLPRNSGFSWEPGRYASMVIIALFFNLVRTQFKLRNNINFLVLTIALLTTQSTTGYFSLLIILFFYILNKRHKTKLWAIFFIIPLVLIIFSLPFVGEKIAFFSDTKNTQLKIENDLELGNNYVPQRFDGLGFEFLNILHDPLLGYGNDVDNSFVKKSISNLLILSNGLFKIFARFGLILGFIFYFLLYKTSLWLSKYYRYKGSLFFLLLYISISVSYDFSLINLYLSLVFFYLFGNENLKYKIKFDVIHSKRS